MSDYAVVLRGKYSGQERAVRVSADSQEAAESAALAAPGPGRSVEVARSWPLDPTRPWPFGPKEM